ncbi:MULTISPECIES: hypothetical protein [Klebsiella]|uniref:hypothetical protein n=1 Tax=Klebsiella TaxID=570 RepID=UPI001993D009|nr:MULTISPECIES: hypothetical protein [Klebsiella]MBD7154304.1 hypothetical protein [Klebsiella pneumoniae]MBP3138352.1 hypothetical protein [Klebsiella pneumoniae]HBM3271204.1 hypothetical protein [Klebsiella michiganensis]
MMDRPHINTDSLSTISECLEQLALAEGSIIAIDGQLLRTDADPQWRKRAEVARRTVHQKKRLIMARLAILRQQEKERNVRQHQQHNDYLIAELRKIVTPSSFIRCARRATEKMETEQ